MLIKERLLFKTGFGGAGNAKRKKITAYVAIFFLFSYDGLINNRAAHRWE